MLNYLTNIVPQFFGGLAFVTFGTAITKFVSNLDYFNNLIFYKQALSALQKAQDLVHQTNTAL